MFVKSGGENYILGTLKLNVPDADKVYIIEGELGGVKWNPNQQPYEVDVASPKKDSKFKGLKSFIAYQLTPTVSIHFFLLRSTFCFLKVRNLWLNYAAAVFIRYCCLRRVSGQHSCSGEV